MADSSIEWTQKTWNPTTGCTKFSKECDFCYAEVASNRYMKNSKQVKYKQGFDVYVKHESELTKPLEWTKPATIFVNSMSDLFHKDMTADFLQKVFKTMNDTPQHTYIVLTKRDKILLDYSDKLNWTDNIWMGVSVGSQASIRKIGNLVKCGAKHKFLSIEPLIGELPDLDLKGIDWVIVGGESGRKVDIRPMKKEWVDKVKKNCDDQNIPFFFKQWGQSKNNPDTNDPTINKLHTYYAKGGCLLDGNIYRANPTFEDDTIPKITLFTEEYLVMDKYEDLNTIWELKSYLPFMDKDLYNELKSSIIQNGLNDPILYIETEKGDKIVVDGHTRLNVCIEKKINDIPTKEIKTIFKNLDEIKLWMVTHQCQKRNLTTMEKVKFAYSSKETIETLARKNQSLAGKNKEITESIDTYLELSKISGVSRSTFVRYHNVIQNGNEAIKDRLLKNQISISAADKFVNAQKNTIPAEKVTPTSIREYESTEKAQQELDNNTINGYIVINDQSEIDKLSKYFKKNYGVVVCNPASAQKSKS